MGKYEEITKARQILELYEFATLKDIKNKYKELLKTGKTKILAKGSGGVGTEAFTEKLAKELGEIEERHRAHGYSSNETQDKVKQGA